MGPARITSFLVKVASRCNLDCDYCYVYHHADQSWRTLPRLMSTEDRKAVADRLAEYAAECGLARIAVIFHGGEPLLAGSPSLRDFARHIRERCGPQVEVDFGLQTNGLLLDDAALDTLAEERISVSLSLDGPRDVSDLHRTTRKGRSSFDRVMSAYRRLERRPELFAGVISVIDADVEPERLVAWFAGLEPPKVDFLLPDAHHQRPPVGRDADPARYERWLIRAFDAWLDHHPQLPVRTFEALLDALSGLPSGTDAFGLGDVSLITIETDGSYHDLDVLKVVGGGATTLGGSVRDTPVRDIAAGQALAEHRHMLTMKGLCATCRACPIVEICGGGSLPHRAGDSGYDNPTVYCGEMLALVAHVRARLEEHLTSAGPAGSPIVPDLCAYEVAETAGTELARLVDEADNAHVAAFDAALSIVASGGDVIAGNALAILGREPSARRRLARLPGSVAWSSVVVAGAEGRQVHDVDGRPVSEDRDYVSRLAARSGGAGLEVAADDPWLRWPFGKAIAFEADEAAQRAVPLVDEALAIVRQWRPTLADEIVATNSAVQFVRDPGAHPDKIVSFSDNAVPGALYVSVALAEGLIDPYDLADSLIHEHRHQKLYLLERLHPTTKPGALVVSPWREDLRPASGLLHAAWVFVELRRFWAHVLAKGPVRLRNRASNQLADTDRNLEDAFATLAGCDLTPVGGELASILQQRAGPDRLAA